jgi:hypothetical protein
VSAGARGGPPGAVADVELHRCQASWQWDNPVGEHLFRPVLESPFHCMDRDVLASLLNNGLSFAQIGREVNVHGSTVAFWAERYGLRSFGSERFAPRGEPDRPLVERLVAKGATLKEIGEAIDRSIATVRYWLRKWDVSRPPREARVDPATAPTTVQRTCKRHGVTRFGLEGRGYYRCLLCRQARVSEWRRRVKRILVEEAGGRCQMCGYDRCNAALQFHHLVPDQKQFSLSHDGGARNLALARAEASKCVLLCANCHAEVEVGHTILDIAA